MWFCVFCSGERGRGGGGGARGLWTLDGPDWGPTKQCRERMLVCFHILLSCYYVKAFYFQNNVENESIFTSQRAVGLTGI